MMCQIAFHSMLYFIIAKCGSVSIRTSKSHLVQARTIILKLFREILYIIKECLDLSKLCLSLDKVVNSGSSFQKPKSKQRPSILAPEK